MSNIHVALWNGLDQVYRVSESAVRSTGNLDSKTYDAFSTFGFQLKHAPFVVGPEEKSAFSQFASAVIHAIDTHHDLEEGEGFFSVGSKPPIADVFFSFTTEYYFPSLVSIYIINRAPSGRLKSSSRM